jgi:hypothetical protein
MLRMAAEIGAIAGRRALPRANAVWQQHENRLGSEILAKPEQPCMHAPLKSEAQSKDYLSKPAKKGE